MGLDPGYRRLFVEYLKEYVAAENKTVFLTSHIIQDMEMLIDDCIILDYGSILLHEPTAYILDRFRRFRFTADAADVLIDDGGILRHTEKIGNRWQTCSFATAAEVERELKKNGIAPNALTEEKLSLEDAFIGLTGKY
jgi:ABC-2 type transport system ATP-binding protein